MDTSIDGKAIRRDEISRQLTKECLEFIQSMMMKDLYTLSSIGDKMRRRAKKRDRYESVVVDAHRW